jgi:hypothetical protein
MANKIAPGRGMDAFFTHPSKVTTRAAAPTDDPAPTVRTTITLSMADAERLELLRMRLRRQRGRGLTYGDVVGLALQQLAQMEQVPAPPRPES